MTADLFFTLTSFAPLALFALWYAWDYRHIVWPTPIPHHGELWRMEGIEDSFDVLVIDCQFGLVLYRIKPRDFPAHPKCLEMRLAGFRGLYGPVIV